MNKHGLTKENLVATLPPALRIDQSVEALAEALGEVLAARPAEIDLLRIYPAIDQLDERLLDILAYDFKVDWWDADYSLEEKRRTLKGSWRVHKTLGTKAAVETALSAIYPGAQVEEWFEYGGRPYHFRVHVKILDAEYDPKKHKRILQRMLWYKNLRSHMERIWYDLPPIIFEEPPEIFFFKNFRVFLRANNYGCIFLNGDHRLDGTWLLDQSAGRLWLVRVGIRTGVRQPHRLGLSIFRLAGGINARTGERIPLRLGAAVYPIDNMGGFIRLNGGRRPDGSWLLGQLPRAPVLLDFRTGLRAREPEEYIRHIAASIRAIQRMEGGRIGRMDLEAEAYPVGPTRERFSGTLAPRTAFPEKDGLYLRRLALAADWETGNRVVIPPPALFPCRGENRQDLRVRGLRLNEFARENTGGGRNCICAGPFGIRDSAGSMGGAVLGTRKLERFNGTLPMNGTSRFNGGSVVDTQI